MGPSSLLLLSGLGAAIALRTSDVPPAVVINLPRNPERFAAVKASLKEAGVKYQRVDAVEGRQMTLAERYENVTALGRLFMTPGMIGCYMSHRKCWQETLKRGKGPLIVFEDDVELSPDFRDKLAEAMQSLPEDWDVCLIGALGAISPKYYHVNLGHAVLAVSVAPPERPVLPSSCPRPRQGGGRRGRWRRRVADFAHRARCRFHAPSYPPARAATLCVRRADCAGPSG